VLLRLQILLMGTCLQCGSRSVAGHNHRKVIGRDPIFVQVSMTWALTCPETVHQRPCMTREIETWLSESRADAAEHRPDFFNRRTRRVCRKRRENSRNRQTDTRATLYGVRYGRGRRITQASVARLGDVTDLLID